MRVGGQKASKVDGLRNGGKMVGLKKENWTVMRDESGRSKRRVMSMLVTNVSDQMWGFFRVRVQFESECNEG